MLAPLLALALAAHAPAPQAAIVAPHARDLQPLHAFLESASRYAPSLAPGPLGRNLGSALAIDALDPQSWADTGLDADQPVSFLAYPRDAAALVIGLRDRAKVLARAPQNLASAGAVTKEDKGGVTTFIAKRPGGEVAGAVAVGKKRVAIWLGGPDAAFLRGALDAKPDLSRAKGLAGPITAAGGDGSTAFGAGLTPGASSIAIDARLATGSPLLLAAKKDRFGALNPEGLLAARADLAPPALAEARAQVVALMKLLFSSEATSQLSALLEQLSGPVALVVTGIDAQRGAGATVIDQYFLASDAYAAQVKDLARAKNAMALLVFALKKDGKVALADAPSPVAGAHNKLTVPGNRALYFGLVDDVLYVADDLAARDALLGALATSSGPVEHSGTLIVDGERVSRALGRLSIFDAARSGQLAALFGLAIEAGPLFKATGATRFVADPEPQGMRVKGTLNLAPPPSP